MSATAEIRRSSSRRLWRTVYSLLGGPTRLIYARDHRCVSVRIVADVVAAAVVYLITGWGNNKWVAHRIIESTDGRLRTTNELRAQDHFAIQSAKLSKHFPPVTLIERWPICWLPMTDDCGREFARCFASGPGKKQNKKKNGSWEKETSDTCVKLTKRTNVIFL